MSLSPFELTAIIRVPSLLPAIRETVEETGCELRRSFGGTDGMPCLELRGPSRDMAEVATVCARSLLEALPEEAVLRARLLADEECTKARISPLEGWARLTRMIETEGYRAFWRVAGSGRAVLHHERREVQLEALVGPAGEAALKEAYGRVLVALWGRAECEMRG